MLNPNEKTKVNRHMDGLTGDIDQYIQVDSHTISIQHASQKDGNVRISKLTCIDI